MADPEPSKPTSSRTGFFAKEGLALAQTLLSEESMRGEQLACKMRGSLMALSQIILVINLLQGRQVEASRWGIVMLAVGLSYNYLLQRRLNQGRAYIWTAYLAVTLDITILLTYTVIQGVLASPASVVTSPALVLLPTIMFFVALRHSKWLVVWATFLVVGGTGLIYYFFLPKFTPALIHEAPEYQLAGLLARLLLMACFGISLMFLPETIKRLISKQAGLFEERQAAETSHRQNLEAQVQSRTAELVKANQELKQALEEVKTLSGLLPICANCKKIRDDGGYWQGVEEYVARHSQAEFTHAICPECMARLYPDLYRRIQDKGK